MNDISHQVIDTKYENLKNDWCQFLNDHPFEYQIPFTIIYESEFPLIVDDAKNKVRIDFSEKSNYQKHKLGIRKEMISKAVGCGDGGFRILDLTAGLGVDSIFLAQLGYQVVALERNPVMFKALDNAYVHWQDQAKKSVSFVFADAIKYIDQILDDQFDVAYYDPMFPDKQKSALPKQEMVLFKKIVGQDSDHLRVLEKAISSKKFKRVVIKRPLKSEKLTVGNRNPAGSILGKVVRYDIY